MAFDSSSNWLDIEKVQDGLDSKVIGKQIMVYGAVSSTNSISTELAKEGKPEGCVVVAQTQRLGYGRLKRTWFSPEGGLWFSVILRPKIMTTEAAKITLMAAVAVVDTLRKDLDLNVRIKWPNDVLIQGKKVCGILTEMRTKEMQIEYVILGIGLNGNFDLSELPDEIKESSTTLKHEKKHEIDLDDLFRSILLNLDKFYHQFTMGNSIDILKKWKELNNTLGRNVRIKTQNNIIEGKALDLDESGALIVEDAISCIQKIYAGDCIHLTDLEGEE
jgi:BirA family biotin operon repressor/biotin-[acetyl-CoA-carboxylase] ligase